MLRLVTLMACGTRTLMDAAFGTDTTGELTYARDLVTTAGTTGVLRPGMLLLGDRNFSATGFVGRTASTGADFLIRAKTHSTALKMPKLRRLPDGTFLSRIGEVTVRVIEATITLTPADGTSRHTATHSTYRLVTSLLDPDEAPATALVRLYRERWKIETSYCELKSTVLGGRVLRGRRPAAVTQETWALLAAYQVLRTAMSDAVLHRPGIDPDRAAFTIALNTARDQIIRAVGIIPHAQIDLVGRGGRKGRTHTATPKLRSYSVPPASGVTVTRADGTTEIVPAQKPQATQKQRPKRGPLICAMCGDPTTESPTGVAPLEGRAELGRRCLAHHPCPMRLPLVGAPRVWHAGQAEDRPSGPRRSAAGQRNRRKDHTSHVNSRLGAGELVP